MSEEICLRSYTTSLRRSDLVHANETGEGGGNWGLAESNARERKMAAKTGTK